ncbi:beta galactosidase jelly roll domain-containing protein [bacterium]|nr:beta galactosidase jelly roll domain-containing protein [bacterium]
MTKFQTILLVLFLFIGTAHADNIENSTSGETRISLNGIWNFKADYYNKGEDQVWFAGNFNDSGWDKMNVPGNWDIRNEYVNFIGKGWYRTTFETPSGIDGKVVRLNFEAVGIDYKVWLNGEQIASVTGGYFSNYINISGKLKSGVKNTLVVCADNTFRSGAYWSWGGIRRPVTLLVNNPVFVKSAHIVAIPDLKKGTASVSLSTILFNKNKRKENVSLDYELSFGGKVIKKGNTTVTLTGDTNQKAGFKFPLAKKEVELWHFDFPNLYTLKLQLKKGNEVVHVIHDRFGIRKAEIVNGEFLLNGEPVRAMGMNWVADDRLTGNTLPAEVYKRDIDNMKALGCNLTRLSHVPLPKEVYDYLDEKGMLIIAEIPVWGDTELTNPENPDARSWMRELVNTGFNHPSIIAWCVGNEIGDIHLNHHVMEYGKEMIRFVKDSLDDSRMSVLVTHSAHYQKEDASQFGDFVPYNTYGSWGSVDKVHEHQPGKMIFISEYGVNLLGEDINTTRGNASALLKSFRGREYVFGASIWTYNDYRSFHSSHDLTWDTKISQNRDWGVVDGFGNKKRAFEILRKDYAPVKEMTVNETHGKTNVVLHPREKLDLPAFTLRDYKLVCRDFTFGFEKATHREIPLPVINPGDPAFEITFPKVTDAKEIIAREISLLTPTGYKVLDTMLYYAVPDAPAIKAIFNDGTRMRVVFDHVKGAASYMIRYGETELSLNSESTIDRFIEVDKLTDGRNFGKVYQVQLVALNPFGESKSAIQQTVMEGKSKLPPVIKAVRAFQNGISIGYSAFNEEYLYKVQYSTSPDFSTDVHSIQTTSKAACYIPDLKAGTTYYIRMSTVAQYDLQSLWSETWTVKI